MVSAAFTIGVVVLERRGVFRAIDTALMNAVSTEHGAIMTLVGFAIAIAMVGMSWLGFLVYRVHPPHERACRGTDRRHVPGS